MASVNRARPEDDLRVGDRIVSREDIGALPAGSLGTVLAATGRRPPPGFQIVTVMFDLEVRETQSIASWLVALADPGTKSHMTPDAMRYVEAELKRKL
jgi:hypothetical protein